MSPSQLPDRPNLEQLKKQAKSLLHAAQAKDPAALQRFAALPAFAKKSAAELGALGLALHDAQSVIAREHGFASWNALREEVEARTLSFDAAVDEFVRCATGGASGRAERLLALHPGHRVGHAADRARARRRGRRRGAVARSSGARDAAGRTAELGAAALRVPHVHAPRRAGARGRSRRDRAAALRARGESERRVSLELASGASAHRAVGVRSARSDTCRSRRCCSRPAPIRPTACPSTSPAAAAISPRSSCCIASAST